MELVYTKAVLSSTSVCGYCPITCLSGTLHHGLFKDFLARERWSLVCEIPGACKVKSVKARVQKEGMQSFFLEIYPGYN